MGGWRCEEARGPRAGVRGEGAWGARGGGREWEEGVGEGAGARRGGWTCVHALLELAFPSAPDDFEVSPVDLKCFPRLAFQICKTFREMFPKPWGS